MGADEELEEIRREGEEEMSMGGEGVTVSAGAGVLGNALTEVGLWKEDSCIK